MNALQEIAAANVAHRRSTRTQPEPKCNLCGATMSKTWHRNPVAHSIGSLVLLMMSAGAALFHLLIGAVVFLLAVCCWRNITTARVRIVRPGSPMH
jgi:hypothetical protein